MLFAVSAIIEALLDKTKVQMRKSSALLWKRNVGLCLVWLVISNSWAAGASPGETADVKATGSTEAKAGTADAKATGATDAKAGTAEVKEGGTADAKPPEPNASESKPDESKAKDVKTGEISVEEGGPQGKKATAKQAKQQIALQLPPPIQLVRNLHFSMAQSRSVLAEIQNRAAAKLSAAGYDPNISLDDAIRTGQPVISIYLRKYATTNFISKQFVIEASLVQYAKGAGGAVRPARYKRFGESPEIYIPAEFAEKALMLVDVYLNDQKHKAELAKKLEKSGKAVPAKKKH